MIYTKTYSVKSIRSVPVLLRAMNEFLFDYQLFRWDFERHADRIDIRWFWRQGPGHMTVRYVAWEHDDPRFLDIVYPVYRRMSFWTVCRLFWLMLQARPLFPLLGEPEECGAKP